MHKLTQDRVDVSSQAKCWYLSHRDKIYNCDKDAEKYNPLFRPKSGSSLPFPPQVIGVENSETFFLTGDLQAVSSAMLIYALFAIVMP